MAAGIGDLNIGNQHIKQLSLLGFPNHLFVEQLATAGPQQIDNALTVREIVPESPGIEKFKLHFLVAGQFAQPPIVEQQAPLLVDHAQRGRTIFEDLAKLTLLLGDLHLVLRQCGDVVDPEYALAADETDMATVVGDLHVG